MRSRSDRSLPEEFRAWIDPTQPLPDDVRLLPREVHVGEDLLRAIGIGAPFAVLGTLMGTLAARLFSATPRPCGGTSLRRSSASAGAGLREAKGCSGSRPGTTPWSSSPTGSRASRRT